MSNGLVVVTVLPRRKFFFVFKIYFTFNYVSICGGVYVCVHLNALCKEARRGYPIPWQLELQTLGSEFWHARTHERTPLSRFSSPG